MSRWLLLALAGLIISDWAACRKPEQPLRPFAPEAKDYSRPLPPGELALRRIGPDAYPDFSPAFDHLDGIEAAIRSSLEYLAKRSSQKYFPYGDISHARAVASLEHFLDVLHQVRSGEELNQVIRRDFDVYQSVGCDDRGTVYFTGYYCPIFEGRKTRDERFRYPLYRTPIDLVKDAEGNVLGRRTPDGRIVPYYTRREIIEQGLLNGTEIAWLKDPFEAYVVTVQGSAKLRLADGTLHELGYGANNGHEYTPVAAAMIQDGKIARDELSLQTLLRYFAAHPEEVGKYTFQNDRYVFFQERAGGPYGSLNVPVTQFRSIATDKQIFPRACLAFVDTSVPRLYDDGVAVLPYAAFACDQDTGGAIRAAGRSDIYMGIGPRAEAVAGRTGAEGRLYYLFLKSSSVANANE